MSVIRVKLVTSSLFGSRNYFKREDKFSWNFKKKKYMQLENLIGRVFQCSKNRTTCWEGQNDPLDLLCKGPGQDEL